MIALVTLTCLLLPRPVTVNFPKQTFVDALEEDLDCGLHSDTTSDCGLAFDWRNGKMLIKTQVPVIVNNDNFLLGIHAQVEGKD